MTFRPRVSDKTIFSSRRYDSSSDMGVLEEATWQEIEDRAQFYRQGYPSSVLICWVLDDMRKQRHPTLCQYKVAVSSSYEAGHVLVFEERSAVDRLSEVVG